MVPNSHLGSLLKGILIAWNLAIFSATSAEMLGSLNSQVSSLRLCQWVIINDSFIHTVAMILSVFEVALSMFLWKTFSKKWLNTEKNASYLSHLRNNKFKFLTKMTSKLKY